MPPSIAIALIALQLLGSSAPSDSFPDAYLDPDARSLLEQARARRSAVEGRIDRYTTVARSRVSIGLRALRRDRMFYRCEAASRIEWNRGDTIRVELLGAREVVPMITGEVRAGDGDCGGSFFDPTADRLGLALGSGMSLEDSSFLRHPLARGSERDYRFRSGGSTAMRLADGTVIRLLELQVLPRRSEPFLVSGSLWLEDRSHAVVRAVLRMARPFDYDRDFVNRPDADDDDDEVPRFLRPLRGDIRYVTIEYGLWEQQWWLPRIVAFEGEADVGRLLAVPLKMERTYAEYDVAALPAGVEVRPPTGMLPDSVCRGGSGEGQDGQPAGGGARASDGAAEGPAEYRERRRCECTDGFCQVVLTRVAADRTQLIHSRYLPRSIFDAGEAFITEREMKDLLARVEEIRLPAWQMAPISWRVGLQGLDLVRYNRVEGLSVGASANAELGGASVDGTVRLGVADLAPNFELAASRQLAFSRQRLALYRRLDAVGPAPPTLGLGSSLSALLFGRDDGDYFRSWGIELGREPSGGSDGLSWRLFGELQRNAEKHTDFSLSNAFGDARFRPNIVAQPAEQGGLQARLRTSRGSDPTGWRGVVTAGLLASSGSFTFAQPMLTLGGAAPLPAGLLAALELSGGGTVGDAPLQSWYFLGGGRTVRGYGGNSARGENFWRARGEVASSAPGARIVVFSDAGWAGTADRFTTDPPLLSVGAGVSFLDGLVRMDIARPLREVPGGDGWRLELQVDAGL